MRQHTKQAPRRCRSPVLAHADIVRAKQVAQQRADTLSHEGTITEAQRLELMAALRRVRWCNKQLAAHRPVLSTKGRRGG